MQTQLNSVSRSWLPKGTIEITEESSCIYNGTDFYLPLGINLKGMKCLIVGAGRIAARKAKTLLKAGAVLTVLSPEIENDWWHEKILNKEIFYEKSNYSSGFIAGYDFIIAATSDSELNSQIADEAKELKKLYCAVSSARSSQVIFPAIYNYEGMTVAVHSSGRDCRRSKRVRDDIAYYLEDRNKPVEQFAVFGFRRSDLPGNISRALNNFPHDPNIKNFGENVLILSTCQRWECYIFDKKPRNKIRTIISLLEQKLSLSNYFSLAYFKYDNAAYYHLIRTITGLDSHLIGETEIIDQVRSAATRYLGPEDFQLARIFDSAVLTSRKLRDSCQLKQNQTSWTNAVVSFIEQKVSRQKLPVISILGAGRLAKSIAGKCYALGYKLEVLSDRFDEATKKKFKEITIPVYSLSEAKCRVHKTEAAVICTALEPGTSDLDIRDSDKEIFVLDMEGNNEFLSKNSEGVHYYKAKDIICRTLDAQQAVAIASAELKAMEQSLFWYGSFREILVPSDELIIGTRPSQLAIAQVDELVRMLKALSPEVKYSIERIDTPGDRDKKTPLPKITKDDFFTCDIDEALLSGRIDIAVHSAKDLPQKIRSGLTVAAVTPSIIPWECLVSRKGLLLSELPAGSVVGTSSHRRREQMQRLRPDLMAADVRGNVPERLEQKDKGKYDALVLASAGLMRLGMQDRITEIFSENIFPYTPGQGSLAIVIRDSDKQLQEFLKPLDLGSKEGLPWL